MRDNRDRWQFYKHPSKPALSPQDVRYWRTALEKTLKVGIEFEFNLPEGGGGCKGDNVHCPCSSIENGCWKACTNISTCAQMPAPDICKNYVRGGYGCNPESCANCNNFQFECLGMVCVDFVSNCFACDSFVKSCDSCKDKYNADKDPSHIREKLAADFKPTKSYGKVGETGVVEIKQDGSLLGDKGAEIITVGRRVDYWEFYNMSKRIIDRLLSVGGFLNERTGSHNHVLVGYYEQEKSREITRDTSLEITSDMEKPMPQIIMANFHQLVRRYQNALTWLTIALDNPNAMTRWEKFRMSVIDVSAVTKDMRKVVEDVHKVSGNKYGFVNYDRVVFANNSSDATRFHIEFREADSTLCPSYYAALACLHYAFVIKAVEISRYGLLKVGDEMWLQKARAMKDVILNGSGDYGGNRVSNTKKLIDNRRYFIDEARDLVGQMKNILIKMGPAYDVLSKLAERPVAMRRIEGDAWRQIEKDLSANVDQGTIIDSKIRELIDLKAIDQCITMDEWVSEACRVISSDQEVSVKPNVSEITKYMEVKTREGEFVWSDSMGCPLAV